MSDRTDDLQDTQEDTTMSFVISEKFPTCGSWTEKKQKIMESHILKSLHSVERYDC